MPPTLLYQKLGNLVVAVQSALPPSDEDWAGYVDLYRRIWHSHHAVRILVVSAGGAPSNLQQRQVDELVPGMTVRIAVVALATPSAQVVRRLIIVNDDMRIFPAEGLDQALDYLDVTDAERQSVQTAVPTMQARLAGAGLA